MTYKFSKRSRGKLKGVHPDLILVAGKAIDLSGVDFGITEGLRTQERQRDLYASGASQTMNSRHLTGDAIDVVAWVRGDVSWEFHYYEKIARAMEVAAEYIGVDIVWGGNWKTFKDGPHFERKR